MKLYKPEQRNNYQYMIYKENTFTIELHTRKEGEKLANFIYKCLERMCPNCEQDILSDSDYCHSCGKTEV